MCSAVDERVPGSSAAVVDVQFKKRRQLSDFCRNCPRVQVIAQEPTYRRGASASRASAVVETRADEVAVSVQRSGGEGVGQQWLWCTYSQKSFDRCPISVGIDPMSTLRLKTLQTRRKEQSEVQTRVGGVV